MGHHVEVTWLAVVLMGIAHALSPCAHSWPMLLPFVGPGRHPLRAAVLFGVGSLVSSVAIGLLIGAVAATVPLSARTRAEEITGVILILLGLLFLLRPRSGHLGHLHGRCDPTHDVGHEPECEHAAHHPSRFGRLGPSLGLVALGLFNMAIPCATNVWALGLAPSLPGWRFAVVFGVYGLVASITMAIILVFVHRGRRVLARLASGRFEALLVRASGLLLIGFGLSLVLHWHEH